MKLQKNILALVAIMLLMTGCKQSPMSEAAMAESDASSPKLETSQVERKLIKEGSVGFETDNIASTRQHIIKSVEQHKGYISSDETYKSAKKINHTLVVRVPANRFDQLLADVTNGVDQLDSKSIQVKDVTEAFLDVQARLKTKKALEKRYLELLTQASTVTEVLAVEKQLGELRSDIESVEGRLNYLENQVTFSTLTITFYKKGPRQSYSANQIKNGFANGWDNLISFFIFLINIWPFIIISIGLIIGIKAWRKRRRAKKQLG